MRISTFGTLIISLAIVLGSVGTAYAQQSVKSNTVTTRVGNALEDQKPGSRGGDGNFVFYCQADNRWASTCNLASEGCGPTSMAMIVSTLGKVMTPPEMDRVFFSYSARSCEGRSGSTMPNILNSSWMGDNKFLVRPVSVNGGTLNLTQAKEYIDQGFLILASSLSSPCPKPGWCSGPTNHIFVVDQVNPSAKTVRVRDPINCRPEHPDEYPTSRERAAGSFPWLYAYAIGR